MRRNTPTVVAGLLTALLALSAPAATQASYRDLDVTFGAYGIARTDLGGEDGAHAVALDEQGRIVAAGSGEIQDPSRPGATTLTVVRYLDDGSPDPAFGGGDGVVQTDTGRQSASFESVAVDSAGRIVATGTSIGFDGIGSNVVVARYLGDGTPDPAFGKDGVVTLGGDGLSIARDALVQPDGIVVLAMSDGPSGLRPTVVRLSVNGSLDESFGTDGQTRLVIGKLVSASAISAAPGGLILAGSTERRAFAAVRLTGNGQVQTRWAESGFASIRFAGSAGATELDVDDGGHPVLAGTCACGDERTTAVARLEPSGAIDSSFSGDGRRTVHLGGRGSAAEALTATQGRGVIIGAVTSNPSGRRSALIRLTRTGALDKTFSSDGISSAGLRSSLPGYRGDAVADVIVDPAGRILAAATLFADTSDFVVARFVP